jgi:hypothetical protein
VYGSGDGAPDSALIPPPGPVSSGVREQRLKLGNLLAILGLAFLVPAMVGVVFVITDLIFGLTAAVIVTILMALSFSLLWFALPLRYRGNG